MWINGTIVRTFPLLIKGEVNNKAAEMSVDDVIHVFKEFINKQDTAGFTSYLSETQDDYDGVWDYIFKKVYIHACLKKTQPIVDILLKAYEELSEIERIAIRQVFPYGRYLLAK